MPIMKKHLLPALLLGFLCLSPLMATNYYVDATSGKDQFAGTKPSKAWKSLNKANAARLQPGDSLLFKCGTQHNGQLRITASGNPTAVLVIGTYGEGDAPRIDANGQYPSAVQLWNAAYIQIYGLELTNKASERIPGQSGISVEARDGGVLRNITLSELYIHDVNGSLVKKQGGGMGISIFNGGKTPSRFEGLVIDNCHIVRTERNGIIFNSDYWARDHWYPNLGVVVRRCLLEEIPGDGIVPLGCDGALVEYNKMCNCTRLLPDGEAAAGIWPWSSDHTLIQFNEVSDHKAPWDAQGFDCDYNCVGTIIQNNYSHDNEGGFLLVCSPSDQRWPWSIGNDSSVVRNNLSVNDGNRTTGPHAGFSPAILITGPVTNTLIEKNQIQVTEKPVGADINLIKMDTWGGRWPSNTTFRKNIFEVSDSASISLGKDIKTVFCKNIYSGKISGITDENPVIFE